MSLFLVASATSADPSLPPRGLSADTLGNHLKELGVIVLMGITETTYTKDLELYAVFVLLSRGHWLLCVKGTRSCLTFDSLGLPASELKLLLPGVDHITRWNRKGYQHMQSDACGYYILIAAIAAHRGELSAVGDVDHLFSFLNGVSIPKTMAQWFVIHTENENADKLANNDRAVYKYVRNVFRDIVITDLNRPDEVINESHDVFAGSRPYERAGATVEHITRSLHAKALANRNTPLAPPPPPGRG